jgi:hypothetical protein
MRETYRESGQFNIAPTLIALVGAILATFLASVAYSFLINKIPIIYLNFLVIAGMGAFLAWMTHLVTKFGAIRNTKIQFGVLAILFIVWIQVHFAAFIGFAFESREFFNETLFSPIFGDTLTKDCLHLIGEFGTWALVGDDAVHGGFLYFLWIVEHIVVVGIAGFAIISLKTVYYEQERCWGVKKVVRTNVGINESIVTPYDLKNGDFSDLPKLFPSDNAFYRFTFYDCPNSPYRDSFYLDIETVTTVVDNKGKTSHKTQTVVSRISVSKADIEFIQNFTFRTADAYA